MPVRRRPICRDSAISSSPAPQVPQYRTDFHETCYPEHTAAVYIDAMNTRFAACRLPSVLLALAAAGAIPLLGGCATGATVCSGTNVVTITPATATADHMAPAPGDQQQFQALSQYQLTTNSPGCAVPTVIAKLTPIWTVSDTVNVKISSAQDATNGLAICIGTTKSPVTVTALGSPVSGGATQTLATATLTCK